MTIKKSKTLFKINKMCSCRKIIMKLPENHRLVEDCDLSNGLWFECEHCNTTLFIPTKKYPEIIHQCL